MFPEQILAIIRLVIDVCKDEEQFAKFGYAVTGKNGFDWIFRHTVLRMQVDVPPPPPPGAAVQFTAPQLVALLNYMIARGWSLDGLLSPNGVSLGTTMVPPPDEVKIARRDYLHAMARGLAAEVPGYWKCNAHPISQLTLAATHETNVTLSPLEERNSCAAWELCGAVSDGWGNRGAVCRAFLDELDKKPDMRPGLCLALLSKQRVADLFEPILAQSGNSCLVGIMVCDIVLSNGKKLRALSLSANMVAANGGMTAHTNKDQPGQIHMEIFHFERLEAVLAALTANPADVTIKSVHIAVLGYKNGTVVKESGMCAACNDTLTNGVMRRLGASVKDMKQEVFLIG